MGAVQGRRKLFYGGAGAGRGVGGGRGLRASQNVDHHVKLTKTLAKTL